MSDAKNNYPPPLVCRKRIFNFQERSYIMGVINVTPDSFSDGNSFFDRDKAVERGIELARQGADILDIGGESTRPGAEPVSLDEELKRVIPVIEELADKVDIPISIDTTKADVAQRALKAGAEVVNDISSLRFDRNMVTVVSDYKVPVVLMHMRGTPLTMQKHIRYDCLIEDICEFLRERINYAIACGIHQDKIIIDPGIGFGKSVETDNFAILKHLEAFSSLGRPVLVGPSRKAFIGRLLGKGVAEREEGTAAAVAIALYNGAHFIRVHNVKVMKMVAQVVDAIKST